MKNEHIKIIINRPPVKSEDINSMQDFTAVMKGFHKISKPIYKKTWFVGSASVLIVAAVTILFVTNRNTDTTEAENKTEIPATTPPTGAPFINPAVKGIDIEFTTFTVESGKAATLEMPTGTKVMVPACPFVNGNGNTIKGNVDIKVREFRDPVDFALSGIPMTYDSAGQRYVFESAGMMEIQGYQNGQAILVNPGCPLKIEQKPTVVDGKFNMYYLDTVAKNWEFKGKPNWVRTEKNVNESIGLIINEEAHDTFRVSLTDKVPVWNTIASEPFLSDLIPKNSKLIQVENEIEQLKKSKPVEPRKADPKRPRFRLEFDGKDFPELKSYKDVLFEVSAEDKNFKKDYYTIDWDKLTLKELEPGVKYTLVMELFACDGKKGNEARKESIVVYPVFDGKDYDAALKTYKEKFKTYEKTLAEKEAEQKRLAEEQRKAQLEAEKQAKEMKKQQEEWARQAAEQQRKWQEDQKKNANERSINYSNIKVAFSADKFGVYNSDYPAPIRAAKNIQVNFKDASGKAQYVDIGHQIIKNRNMLMSNYFYGRSTLKYNPQDENILFVAFPDGKIGYMTEADFAKLPTSGSADVTLTMSTEKFETIGQIKAFLGVGKTDSRTPKDWKNQ